MSARPELPRVRRVRVELRLDEGLAERLYKLAGEQGSHLSVVGNRVIEAGLDVVESEGSA